MRFPRALMGYEPKPRRPRIGPERTSYARRATSCCADRFSARHVFGGGPGARSGYLLAPSPPPASCFGPKIMPDPPPVGRRDWVPKPNHYRALAKYSTAGWHPNLFAMSATQPRGSAESSRSLSASAVCYPSINTQHSKKVVRRKGKSRW